MLKSNRLDFERKYRARLLKDKRKYKQTTFIVNETETNHIYHI